MTREQIEKATDEELNEWAAADVMEWHKNTPNSPFWYDKNECWVMPEAWEPCEHLTQAWMLVEKLYSAENQPFWISFCKWANYINIFRFDSQTAAKEITIHVLMAWHGVL